MEREDLLRASEEMYRGLVETSTDAIVSVNEERRIIQWNRAACKVFGYSEDEVMGKLVDILVPEKYQRRHVEGFKEFLETGVGKLIGETMELEGLRKDGTTVPVELSLSALQRDDSYIVTGIIRDITERKRAEEELRAKTERLAVISGLDRIISSSLDIREVYDAFADGVKRLVDYDRISVALYDEEKDAIRMHLVRTKGKSKIPEGSWRPKKGTVIGHVIDTGEPFIRRDVLVEKEFMEDEAIIPEGLRSYVAVPLYSKGRVVGTFNLGSSKADAYSEEDLDVLEDLSKQLAIAIENSRLYEGLRERVEELQEFHDLTVDRELKMIELKKELKKLREELKKEEEQGARA